MAIDPKIDALVIDHDPITYKIYFRWNRHRVHGRLVNKGRKWYFKSFDRCSNRVKVYKFSAVMFQEFFRVPTALHYLVAEYFEQTLTPFKTKIRKRKR